MALKQCGQCSEMVDEAKAFCPGCGNAFVSERSRGELTDFEAKGQTVQLGQTMYNQMLSDMGLNISKAAIKIEPGLNVQEPAKSPVSESVREQVNRVESHSVPEAPKQKKGVNVWLIVGIVAVVLLVLAVIVVIAAAAAFFYLTPI